ncbi:MAG: hypothetical protein GY757_13230, partial [bacterium]|nr:hypothetical protein [bacterium]
MGYNLIDMTLRRNWIKKNKLLLPMLAVILPGLLISGLGLLSVSNQKNSKELELRANIESSLSQIGDSIVKDIRSAISNTFNSFNASLSPLTLDDPPAVLGLLKGIIKENPVVKYPFLMAPDGTFIFPFPGKTRRSPVTPFQPPPNPGDVLKKDSSIYRLFKNAEVREFK